MNNDKPVLSNPFFGVTNTNFNNDHGAREGEVQKNARKQQSFLDVRTYPREAKMYFRFGGSQEGCPLPPERNTKVIMDTMSSQENGLAYAMESQGVKFRK